MNDLSLLVPGSIWKRERKGKEFLSIVICVTNSHLSDELQEKNGGARVVYLDQKGRWNSLPVDRFVGGRQFHDQNATIASQLENLGAEEEEEVSFDSPMSFEEVEASLSNDQPSDDSQEDEQFAVPVSFIQDDAEQTPSLTISQLTAAIASYSQTPNLSRSSIQHELLFALDDVITIDSLRYAFSSHNPGGYAAFQFGDTLTEFDVFTGVYPVFTIGGAYAKVVFENNINFEEDIEESASNQDSDFEVQVTTSDSIKSLEVNAPSMEVLGSVERSVPNVSLQAQSVAQQIVQQ